MSEWIESHAALREHPKLKRLARSLGVNRREATGLLHWLWWWAMDYAPDGDLSDFSDEDIADGLDWEGDAGKLMSALRDAGFVDGMTLHDWDEYGGKLHWRRKANAERMRAARASHANDAEKPPSDHVHDTCNARAVHVSSERTDRQTDRHLARAREEAVDNSGRGEDLVSWAAANIRGWEKHEKDAALIEGLMRTWSEVQVRTVLASVAQQSGRKMLTDPRAYLRKALKRAYPPQPPPPSTVPKDARDPTPEDKERAQRIVREAAARFRT